MQNITPCIWFDMNAEEAAEFYVSVFAGSRILQVSRYGEGGPAPEGTALTVDLDLDGLRLQFLNGGPGRPPTEAFSLVRVVDGQSEVDRIWNALLEGGGTPNQCGWLADRFGVSWQVVPQQLIDYLGDPDSARASRVMQAMLRMGKIEIPLLDAAYAG